MLFNSTIFLFVFLPIAYAVFWILRSANARYVWLTITGYVFYAYWDPRFTLLMAFSTLVSYTAGLGFLRWDAEPRRRKLCLVAPIVTDLTLLAFFKYANFGLSTAGTTLRWLTGREVSLPHLSVILPIGISFYTFHTIGYIVDSYRRQVRPTRNIFEFAAFVSLFSQLVAGPIVRFRAIEGDLLDLGRSERTRWMYRGISFFAYGLVAKVLVADTLGAFVDPALAHYRELSSLGAWMAMLGYTFQLYFDFDGYSCMAVGLGYLFGLRIPQNFDSPYKALDPSDFWRRWHISLSACLRDYVYIPLGGSRRGAWLTYRNLLLTMLIGGLWHGAGWTFVVWGAYHGMLLALYKRFGAAWDRLPKGVRQLGMFLFAVLGWVLFRATDFGMAMWLLRAMLVPTPGSEVLQPGLAAALLLLAGWWSLRGPNAYDLHRRPEREWAWGRQAAVAASLGASLAIILGSRPSPFLYFQF